MHMPRRIGFLLAALMAFSGMVSAQTIYEWQSDNGERHYSDMPPNSVVVEDSGLSITLTSNSVVEASEVARRAQEEAQGKLDASSKEEANAQAEVAQKEQAQRAANCIKARQTLTTYNNNRRVYKKDESGEVEWLDIDAERAKAQDAVNTWCN